MTIKKEWGKAPCKGCEERYPACHDTCEKYKTFRAEVDDIKHIKQIRNEFEAYCNQRRRK